MSTRRISVNNLQLNMYVSELDRPWLGTPFLFQGFRITNQKEIEQLRECCNDVYILCEEVEQEWISSQRMSAPPTHRFETAQVNISPAATSPTNPTRPLYDELHLIKKTYDELHLYMHVMLGDMRLGHSVDTALAQSYVDQLVDSIMRNDSALTLLAQLKSRDEYTVQHSLNVCLLSILFGKFYGLSLKDLRVLGIGALLHDIGKVDIPEQVLNKPGALTDAEFGVIKRHPEKGYKLLSKWGGVPNAAMLIARDHHERVDGRGYPQALSKEQIALFPQLVSIVDVYDAITTQRCYHQALSPHEALKLMFEQCMGSFPVEKLNIFIQCLSIFPVGSIVELSSGEVGVVMTANQGHHLQPLVLRVLDEKKQRLAQHSLISLSSLADMGVQISIRRILESGAYGIDTPTLLREHCHSSQLAIEMPSR